METVTIDIKGMTCSGCVASVRRVLQAVAGVRTVEVSLEQGQAVVQYEAATADPARLRAAVEGAGYEVA